MSEKTNRNTQYNPGCNTSIGSNFCNIAVQCFYLFPLYALDGFNKCVRIEH